MLLINDIIHVIKNKTVPLLNEVGCGKLLKW